MRARALALTALVAAACSGDAPPPSGMPVATVQPIEPAVLRLAGSGTMVPLARALGGAYRVRYPDAARIVVEDSIGSGGGIRAALDGAIDVGLVSRRLSAAEAGWPLVVLPIARDAVIFAANPDVSVDGVTSGEMVALFNGERRTFSDDSPAVLLLRDRSESANLALDAAIPSMAAAREHAFQLGFRVLYHDDAMAAALAVTPGSVGVYSLGLLHATRIPVKVLKLDGHSPSAAGIADGSWPLTRPLALVVRADRLDHARAFLHLAASREARRIVAEAGYLPLGDDPVDGEVPRRFITAAQYAAGALR